MDNIVKRYVLALCLYCLGGAGLVGCCHKNSASTASEIDDKKLAAITGATVQCIPSAQSSSQTIRCAVIGGMTQTGFWDALAKRFESVSGCRVEVVATGPKGVIAQAFLAGDVDFITMHSSDTIVNLAADGYVENLQPWVKNDLVIVGPPEDPAGIRGMSDPVEAMRIIIDRRCNFVVHQSLGAQDVLKGIMKPAGLVFDEHYAFVKLDDRERGVLLFAAEQQAYTLVGRIPFLSGKMPNERLVIMVIGDPRLRRPYLSAVASPRRCPGVHYESARKLQDFLNLRETQSWIAEYGRGQLDEYSLFIPIGTEGTLPRTAVHDRTATLAGTQDDPMK